MTALSILFVGLLLGLKHATEADHLAAVASLATRRSSIGQSLRVGVAWGIGHTLTLMVFAGAVVALGREIPASLENALEAAVGAMLVALGADVLRRLWRDRIHFHVHRHGSIAHVHAHSHRGEASPHAQSRHEHRHAASRWPLRALAVGTMHGLAGSAALVVLSVQSVPSVGLALGYIAVFGLGSIAGMALLSVAVAVPLRLSAGYLAGLHGLLNAGVGVATLALGAVVLAERLLAA